MHQPTPLPSLNNKRCLLMNEAQRVLSSPHNADRILRSRWLHSTMTGGKAGGATRALRWRENKQMKQSKRAQEGLAANRCRWGRDGTSQRGNERECLELAFSGEEKKTRGQDQSSPYPQHNACTLFGTPPPKEWTSFISTSVCTLFDTPHPKSGP